ncbi:MAG: FkbM family methyltransferase [Pseudomonadota bacterium]
MEKAGAEKASIKARFVGAPDANLFMAAFGRKRTFVLWIWLSLLKPAHRDARSHQYDSERTFGMSKEFGLPLYYDGVSLEQMQDRLRRTYLEDVGWNESADRKLASRNGEPVPWFTYSAIDFLERELGATEKIFEYGGGQSTLYWAERVNQISSVDHDEAFGAYIKSKLPENATLSIFGENAPLPDELYELSTNRPHLVDPERTEQTFRSGQLNNKFLRYGLDLLTYEKDHFDVVIVDGMARNLSTWSAIEHFQSGGFIVFDNSDRDYYQPAFDMLEAAQYRRIDFSGLGPVNPYGWRTSVFYKPSSFTGTTWFKPATHNPESAKPDQPNANKLGILVLGFNRPFHLQAVLESLRLQDRLSDTHVWIDGTQGRGEYADKNKRTIEIAKRFPLKELSTPWGHFGIEKLMLDALEHITSLYDRVLILEDDCFPLEGCIDAIERELDEVAEDESIYSIYGHHFGTEPSENRSFSRFQGWGWAAHSRQIQRILPELRELFNLNEGAYLAWVKDQLNDEIVSKLDRTPGRNVLGVLDRGYSWDSATCLLTARDGLSHRRTDGVTIKNTGITEGVGHFQKDTELFRSAPLNMITVDECWSHYDTKSVAVSLDGRSHALDELDTLLEPHLPDTPGFFIELGAFDGVTQSNSVKLESKGWKGMLIEANPGAYARCVKSRPGCLVEHAACVSSEFENETLKITDVGLMSVPETSDLDSDQRADWIERGASFAKRAPQVLEVRAKTLSHLLDQNGIEQIDLLLLDVEGAEVDVLAGIDFSRHAPKLIVAEDAYSDSVEAFLISRGYSKKAVLLERKYTRDQLYVRQMSS